MASDETLLGTVLDADTDPVHVYADTDGGVVLRWEHGADMAFGRTGRDKLRELLDRAAMPGQAHVRPCCDHCNNGEGDPAGHDYIPGGSAHDGPCEQCAAERARREHDEGTG